MDRRKTLAGLPTHGNSNSRGLVGPGGAGAVKEGTKTGGTWGEPPPPPTHHHHGGGGGKLGHTVERRLARMSLAGPVQRRASTFTGVKVLPGMKADPRPLGDKVYQGNCARTIIAFLSANGYEYQILPKTLSSPTTKDFTNIMMFLTRHVDPNLLKGFGKLEEEVPQLFKRLKYPFQISKSNLAAVGSPHTWPTILAALCWIVELLNYSSRAEVARLEVNAGDDRAKAEAEFFEYVSKSYRHFMAGEDDMCQAVDEEKVSETHEKSENVKNEIERLKATNESLKAEIEELRSKPSPLVAAREKLEETLSDKERFLKLIENLTSHKSNLQRKIQERQADVASQTAELAVVEEENETLRTRIANQTIHPADVERMNLDRQKQEAALKTLSSQREAAESKAAACSMALESKLDELEACLSEYHSRADRLQLIPISAKRSEGIVYEISLDRIATTSAAMVNNIDLKGIIKPALQRLRDSYSVKARELAEEELFLAEKRDAVSELVTERAEEANLAEMTVKDLEAQYRAGKEELEAGVAAALAQVEGLAAEVSHMRGAANADVIESEEQLRNIQAEYEELQKNCDLENAMLHRDLAAALEAILNHKLAVGGRLKGTAERVEYLVEEVASLPTPSMPA